MLDAAGGFDCFYSLDVADRLLDWGGPSWNGFAISNGAAALTQRDLTGDSIYAHIVGRPARSHLQAFIRDARSARGSVLQSYRCDSPSVKRLMEMRARAGEDGALRIEHRLVAQAPLRLVVACQEIPGDRRVAHLRCASCNRLRGSAGRDWREPDEYGRAGRLKVAHVVCADCRSGDAARQMAPSPRNGRAWA